MAEHPEKRVVLPDYHPVAVLWDVFRVCGRRDGHRTLGGAHQAVFFLPKGEYSWTGR